MNENNLIEELDIDIKELYKKYEEYQECKKLAKPDSAKIIIASTIFGVPESNKIALFFLLMGLKSIEEEIKFILKEN